MKYSVALAALAAISSVHAEIFDEAHKFAPAIIKAAVHTNTNKVYLRNVKTGKYLAYTRENDTPDLTFSNSPYAVDVSKIDGNKYAFGFADNRYCLSSAWNFTLGLNEYSTLYACCGDRDVCDNGSAEFGPLREAKQQLILVPVGENALVTMVKAIIKSGIDLLKRDGPFSSALTGDHFSAVQMAKKHLARRLSKRDRESRAEFEKRCAKHKALALAAGNSSEDVAPASDDDEEEQSTPAPKKVDHKALAAKLRAQKAQEAADAAAEQAAQEKSEAAKEAAQEKAEAAAKQAAQDKAEAAKEAAAEKAAAAKAAAAKAKADQDEEDSKPSKSSGHKNSNVIARVHMVAVDHLTDMLTRSLSCQLIMGAGNYMSVRLDVLDDNDTCQQWDVIRA